MCERSVRDRRLRPGPVCAVGVARIFLQLCSEWCSGSPVSFHMEAELPGAGTVEAMSRPEKERLRKFLRKPKEKLRVKMS